MRLTRDRTTKVLILDEVSNISGIAHADISESYQILLNDKTKPYGGLDVIIMYGDYQQLPCIPESNSVPWLIDRHFLQPDHSRFNLPTITSHTSPAIAGTLLLVSSECRFHLSILTEQVRIREPFAAAIVNHLGDLCSDQIVSEEVCDHMEQHNAFTAQDLIQDYELPLADVHKAFIMGQFAVASNRDKGFILPTFTPELGRFLGAPGFRWRLPLTPNFAELFTAAELDIIYKNNPHLYDYHIAGAPAYISQENQATSLGIANGRFVHLYSLHFDQPYDEASFLHNDHTGSPLTVFDVPCPSYRLIQYFPEHISVDNWPSTSCLFRGEDVHGKKYVVLALPFAKKPLSVAIVLPSGAVTTVTVHTFPVQLALASTCHKILGKTLHSLIADLRVHSHKPKLTHAMLNVELSRVRGGLNKFRYIALPPGEHLRSLRTLTPDLHVRHFLRGFGPDGFWSLDLARTQKAAYTLALEETSKELVLAQSMRQQPGICGLCRTFQLSSSLTFCSHCNAHACAVSCAGTFFPTHTCK